MQPTSIYLHIPFCRHRCAYCDFNTYTGQEGHMDAYIAALCREIEQVGRAAPQRLEVHTVFFGGGTPSLIPPAQIAQVMDTLRRCFDLQDDLEATLEANPGTVNLETLRGLRAAGVNRLSFGVQSAHPDDLRVLERQHDYLDVVQAVKSARLAGFENLSLDLIFGVPGQTLERWQTTLELALGLHPEHLSLYALTVEHGTPFARWTGRGLISMPDDDLAADMYEWASERLEAAGYRQYEISNWAIERAGALLACRHNLQYWRGLPYLGFGAGAHGYAADTRTANLLAIPAYIQRCTQASPARAFPLGPALANALPINRRTAMQERMMVGLRLTAEGVAETDFCAQFGAGLEEVFGKEIAQLVEFGLLEWHGSGLDRRVRLTRRGRLLGNRVFMQFVGD